jgi:hypothetical protein
MKCINLSSYDALSMLNHISLSQGWYAGGGIIYSHKVRSRNHKLHFDSYGTFFLLYRHAIYDNRISIVVGNIKAAIAVEGICSVSAKAFEKQVIAKTSFIYFNIVQRVQNIHMIALI